MGIDTFLVMEPGHMFLGIYLDREGKQSACLETTMLGDPDPPKCVENHASGESGDGGCSENEEAGSASITPWISATREFRKHRLKYEKENDPDYDIVDIAAARREGIAPIGYVKQE